MCKADTFSVHVIPAMLRGRWMRCSEEQTGVQSNPGSNVLQLNTVTDVHAQSYTRSSHQLTTQIHCGSHLCPDFNALCGGDIAEHLQFSRLYETRTLLQG
jgi:hypothetical protein